MYAGGHQRAEESWYIYDEERALVLSAARAPKGAVHYVLSTTGAFKRALFLCFFNMGHQRGGVNRRILTVGLVGFKCNQIHYNSIIYLTYTKPCPLDMHKSKDAKQTWKYISSISFLLWDYRGLHEHTVLFQRLPNLGFIFMYECLCVCTLSLLLFFSGQS